MKKSYLLLFSFLVLAAFQVIAQSTIVKKYVKNTKAGDVILVYNYGELRGTSTSKIYAIDAPKNEKYYLQILANLQKTEVLYLYVDDVFIDKIYPTRDGWQYINLKDYPLTLTQGKHILQFETAYSSTMIPMVDEIYLTLNQPSSGRNDAPEAVAQFLNTVEQLKQQPLARVPTVEEAGDLTNKVLPNPQGNYDHAIDTNFTYSHFSVIYLAAGNHTFTTSGSTVGRSLTIFNPNNYIYSWSNANSGPGGESGLYLYVGLTGWYNIMLRPISPGSGITNILHNGNMLVSGAIVGGRTYAMSSLKGGPLNFFTCKLTGSGDTRMFASRHYSSSARGYNDDYTSTGDWYWGYSSRIKKDFSGIDSVQYGYVCAYSPTSTGISDVYLGNGNSPVHSGNYPEFPLLKTDDAILTANTGYYNCISWSGGVTSSWIWPPGAYSTYNCSSSGTDITCFDNFYSNNPVRYPGAWNYTRTGANSSNSIVDVWALNSYYTHASVRKPGNNHPHGYDWESKPGGTPRTLHPRAALTNLNAGYGGIVNYYIPTGTYARNGIPGLSFESDADAVKAGVAVFENARLTETASQKLNTMLRKTNASFSSDFNQLYDAWKNTWERNAIYSDPAMYCRNAEFEAMAQLANKNRYQAMLLVFDKFVGGDHLIGELMWTLTKEKYAHLLTEVKTERAANPNDASGKYKVHGDHDNGVLYVEKILKVLEEEAEVLPIVDGINVIVSPNPVKDRMTVQVITTKSTRISVKAVSAQTRMNKVLQPETLLPAGTHRFSMDITGFTGATGDIIAVQVVVDGVMKTVKVLVTK